MEKCIHDFFVEQAALEPEQRAVAYGEESLTYRELYDRCLDLALVLQAEGVGPDGIVGLCAERSLEMMSGIMGTVMAGGAYLPLDPSYPDERLTYMLADSRARVVLTQGRWKERIRALAGSETTLIALDDDWSEVASRANALRAEGAELRREAGPRNLCYVIYTSGSTGRPKGVLVEHQALVNRLHWMQKSYPIGPGDVVLQKTPYSFDVSVWEFFWPMMTGASIVFAVPEGHKDVGYLEALIREEKVTTLHYVPSMLTTFLENARGELGGVRQMFCERRGARPEGGRSLQDAFPECRVAQSLWTDRGGHRCDLVRLHAARIPVRADRRADRQHADLHPRPGESPAAGGSAG